MNQGTPDSDPFVQTVCSRKLRFFDLTTSETQLLQWEIANQHVAASSLGQAIHFWPRQSRHFLPALVCTMVRTPAGFVSRHTEDDKGPSRVAGDAVYDAAVQIRLGKAPRITARASGGIKGKLESDGEGAVSTPSILPLSFDNDLDSYCSCLLRPGRSDGGTVRQI